MKYLFAIILFFFCSPVWGATRYYVRVAPGVVNIVIMPHRHHNPRVPTLSKPPYNPIYNMTPRAPVFTIPRARRAASPWQPIYVGEPLMIYNPYYEKD